MKENIRKLLYITTILAVLFMSAMPSYAVYADGGTEGDPPPEDPPVTTPAETPAEDPAATSPEKEAPSDEGEPANPPAEVETSEELQSEGKDPSEEAAPVEEPVKVTEILEQVPDGTDLIVINEEGQPEPLASEAAAEILIGGDPIWCPVGVAPDPTNPSCTASHTGFDDLIADLAGGTYSGAGVIWVGIKLRPNRRCCSHRL